MFDPVTAQRIRSSLNKKTDMAWHANNGRERQETRHRRADAIAELLTRTTHDGYQQPASASVVLVADYDVIDQKLAHPRLADGTRTPEDEFHKLACNAEILPGIFNSDLQPLTLGRQRHASPQLSAALIARNQGCIGCHTQPEWCVTHHTTEWHLGRPTQPDNLVLVCHPCHDKIHHHNWTMETHPDTSRYYLKPP